MSRLSCFFQVCLSDNSFCHAKLSVNIMYIVLFFQLNCILLVLNNFAIYVLRLCSLLTVNQVTILDILLIKQYFEINNY